MRCGRRNYLSLHSMTRLLVEPFDPLQRMSFWTAPEPGLGAESAPELAHAARGPRLKEFLILFLGES
jgi:hypothetical protein